MTKMIKCNILGHLFLFMFLCCYVESNVIAATARIDIAEYPSYFSQKDWEAIRRVEEILNLEDVEKIVGVLDAKINYIGGLSGKNSYQLQQKIDKILKDYDRASNLDDLFHGTAVASLITGIPNHYDCFYVKNFSSKPCNGTLEKLVVSGIVKNLTIINAQPTRDPENVIGFMEDILTEIYEYISTIDPLPHLTVSQRKERENRYGRNLPVKIILNLSFRSKKLVTARLKLQEKLEHIFQSFDDNAINQGIVLFIVAAGNDSEELKKEEDAFSGVIGDKVSIQVGAGCGPNYDQLCDWSNFGKDVVDIIAPGEHIPVVISGPVGNTKATYVNGTSFSVPLVTGLVSLLAQCKPKATASEIRKKILETARKDSNLNTKIKDGRVLNIKKIIDSFCMHEVSQYGIKPKKELQKKDFDESAEL